MLQYLIDGLFYVLHQQVKLKNIIFTKVGPIIDYYFNWTKPVILPYVSDDHSGFTQFTLQSKNTKLHYYFKYNSNYNYDDAMKFLNNYDILETVEGVYKLIEIEDDLTVQLNK
jgi:hypothetical protein